VLLTKYIQRQAQTHHRRRWS